MPESITRTYTGINPVAIRDKLVSAVAICVQPERTERHQLYDVINPQSHVVTGYIELQVETSRISLTYHPLEGKADTPATHAASKPESPEIRMGVSDFDTACKLLSAMGMHPRSFEETKREMWSLGNASIAIDTWPWLDPFVTITAPTDKDIETAAVALGITEDQKYGSNIAGMYKDAHGIDESVFYNTPQLMFMSRPDWLKWEDPPEPPDATQPPEPAAGEAPKDGKQSAEGEAPKTGEKTEAPAADAKAAPVAPAGAPDQAKPTEPPEHEPVSLISTTPSPIAAAPAAPTPDSQTPKTDESKEPAEDVPKEGAEATKDKPETGADTDVKQDSKPQDPPPKKGIGGMVNKLRRLRVRKNL